MRERPNLADELVLDALGIYYGISTAQLTFLPLGNDPRSSAYRVEDAGGTLYFLKVRDREGFSLPSLVVPHYLCSQGVPHVLAPLPTADQSLWVNVGDFALSLYPFIDGQMGAHVGLTADQWRTFGALVRQVHGTELPPDLLQTVPRETFRPHRWSQIPDLLAMVDKERFETAVESELSVSWHAREDEIRVLLKRTEALGDQLRLSSTQLVPCHADMHLWNVLIDADRQLWLIDWDETMLAPKERDLMFVVGGIGGYRTNTDAFLQGYGDTVADPSALVYYRYAWAVQDMLEYGVQVLLRPEVSESAKRDALRGFESLFEPGNIVSLAIESEIVGE